MKPCKSMRTGIPLGITVHNTEEITSLLSGIRSAAEQYVLATYNGNMGGAIVHYYVSDGVVWQLLDDYEQGWHSGTGSLTKKGNRGGKIGGNVDTIAIEVVGKSSGTEETAKILVAYLCRKYGFAPHMDVYTHKYWSGKYCPRYILPHWEAFIDGVSRAKTVGAEMPVDDSTVDSSTVDSSTVETLQKPITAVDTDGNIKVGDTVKITLGAVYGGAVASIRGKPVPRSVCGKPYVVKQVREVNERCSEALLGGIHSWVSFEWLYRV